MDKTKALTQIPLGAIKDFIENNFDNISFSKGANDFFNSEFLGNDSLYEDLIDLKDGKS